jgi:D-alanine transaminase
MCSAITPIPVDGVRAVTLDDIRWQWCHIKAITLLANVLLRQEAVDRGAAEAILVRDGWITEGAASNVFAVIDGVLTTPPKGSDLLPGITRDLVLELARENGVPAVERRIQLDDLKRAPEIWLTSSTREILPVIELDGVAVGRGEPGPLWPQMQAVYQAYKHRLRMT